MKKRVLTGTLAGMLTGAMVLSQSFSAMAIDDLKPSTGDLDNLPYTIYFEPQRTLLTAEEVANGDVAITADVRIAGSTAYNFGAVKLHYGADNDKIYFQNLVTGSTRFDQETTYQTSLGEITTSLMPYCFGKLDPKGRYVHGSPNQQSTQYACDTIFGQSFYSNGNGGVKFTLSYYDSASRENRITRDYDLPVEIDENGDGYVTYDYINPVTYQPAEATVKLPRFDPNLPVDAPIPSDCTRYLWLPGMNDLDDGAAFFGETSDEFPLFRIDIVVPKDMPCGVYSIDFSDEVSDDGVASCSVRNIEGKNYQYQKQGTSIAVGVKEAVVTSVEGQEDVARYVAHDTHKITGNDFADKILADVTFEDGTTQSNVDITDLINCNGATPADLFKAASGGVFSSNVPLCIGSTPLKMADGSAFTQAMQIAKKGDVNFDGTVNLSDAYATLMYNSYASIGQDPTLSEDASLETLAYYVADTDTCSKTQKDGGEITLSDAYNILMYSSYEAINQHMSWSSVMK